MKKTKKTVREEQELIVYHDKDKELKRYVVLKTHDNEKGNGMQAMAVAPINSTTGKAEESQVVIAYAGTNAQDDLDI